jgi:hypothetical protein
MKRPPVPVYHQVFSLWRAEDGGLSWSWTVPERQVRLSCDRGWGLIVTSASRAGVSPWVLKSCDMCVVPTVRSEAAGS